MRFRHTNERRKNVKSKVFLGLAILLAIAGISAVSYAASPQLEQAPRVNIEEGRVGTLVDDPSPPTETVKLIFIHHSCGENWLGDGDGGLGTALKNNNYFVSDTNYGWGPPDADLGYDFIGDHTDIGHWYNWFIGPNHITYTTALYTEFDSHSYYTRTTDPDPSRQNEIVMFKSCYPNSYLDGNPGDPPTTGANPLRGQDVWSGFHTVANAKGIYNDLLTYFATHQDKLFIAITAPPQMESETDATHAANARAFNNWLVNDWLDGYSYDNVAVFDFYNVLTSNGGGPNTNDEGEVDGNHHRWLAVDSRVQHTQTVANNYSAYWGGNGGGSHPTAAGNQKATAEFVPLLNVFYNRWRSGASVAPSLSLTSPSGGDRWPVSSTQQIRWDTSGVITQVNLAYAIDGLTTTIEMNVDNTGVYSWTTPSTPTTSARVRVESVVSTTTIYDVSDEFTLYKPVAPSPALTLTAPTGSTRWPVSSTRQIRWDTSGVITQVNLAYAIGGVTRTIELSVTNTGAYTWTTPPTPTTSARVRVESVVSTTTVYDVSDAFTLYEPGDYTVYLPVVLRNHTTTPPSGSLIQASDLVYLGAFRLPDLSPGTLYTMTWNYGGGALTYYPDDDDGGPNDGYPGSLFGAGHAVVQAIGEFNIPVPVISAGKSVTELNTADSLQDPYDVKSDVFPADTYWEIPRAGLTYLPSQGAQATAKLYFSFANHAPGEDQDAGPTHGWCELDLGPPQAAGIWSIGGYSKYVTADYMFDIPQTWADAHVSGRYLVTGRFRDGGQAAMGPSLIAAAPWEAGNPPISGTVLSATPLLLYDNILASDPISLTNYHHSDEWSGAVWLTAGARSAVVFVGTKGQGDCWYGCADGTDEPPWPPDCNRGWWSTSFVGQLLFYDPDDLAAVAQGTLEPSAPQPYATMDIDEYLYHIESTQQWHHLGAAAFDRDHGLLYISEPRADEDKPLVHVWRVQ
jgi:hypothetical protein